MVVRRLDQELKQGLLRVQAVFSLVPGDRTLIVKQVEADFFATVGGQAVQVGPASAASASSASVASAASAVSTCLAAAKAGVWYAHSSDVSSLRHVAGSVANPLHASFMSQRPPPLSVGHPLKSPSCPHTAVQ